MNESTGIDEVLKTTSRVLIWCFVLLMVYVLLWFGLYALAGRAIYNLHLAFFGDMTPEQFQMVHYCGMGLVKVVAFGLFLCPYIAIRLTLRGRKKQA